MVLIMVKKCSSENQCGKWTDCIIRVKCRKCGKEFRKCMMTDQNSPQETKQFGEFWYCEECNCLARGEQAGREYMESLLGQEIDEGITVTRSNIHELFKNGYL